MMWLLLKVSDDLVVHLQKGEELYSLMVTGRKDDLWRSVVHLGGLSLE